MATRKIKINEIFHPDYRANAFEWRKYRLTFEGGKAFVDEYLKKFSIREDSNDFATRKLITYCPAHAKAAIVDIKNAIYQRLVEIQRINGPESYKISINGGKGGVNKAGMTMTTFIGTEVLPELIALSKVGIFIDKGLYSGPTKLDSQDISPYLYCYPTEDIHSWTYEDNILTAILLKDYVEVADPATNLIIGKQEKYRYLRLLENGVSMTLYNADGKQEGETIIRPLSRIPFVIAKISQSLLTDVADYQIALLNLESSDIGYSLKSNFPFYVEQFNPQSESFMKVFQADNTETGEPARENVTADGIEDARVGVTHGRKYAKGLERPSFINPSSEPLRASMEKEDQLKEDIRKLVNLSLRNLARPAGSQSADLTDEQGLEAGLSYIGMELERAEREISEIWALYEKDKPAIIKYPKKYSLKSEKERVEEAKELIKIKETVPSKTGKKEIDKQVVTIVLENKVSFETLEKIKGEIDTAIVTVTDHETVREDHKEGLVSDKVASTALGYPDGDVEQAKKDHAERASRIAEAQSRVANRGVKDLQNLNDDDLDKIDKNRRGASDDNN